MLRKGCHPRIMEHSSQTDKAIVLIHGLTDSPYFMTTFGKHFYNLGYNVYLPLLHCHGLKEPKGMKGIELEEWKANVEFAIDTASSKVGEVSICGLSTGGTLSFYMSCTNSKINGKLYLFSAALDLAGGPLGLFGEIAERFLRTGLTEWLDKIDEKRSLIGDNPYRYDRIDKGGAKELAHLIKETDKLLEKFDKKNPFPKKVFAAHSEFDHTAHIKGIYNLQERTHPDNFTFFRLPEKDKIPHASVVLKENVEIIDKKDDTVVLEEANPKFSDMMEAVTEFEKD